MPFISEVPPIYIQRWYTGWITNRNQLVTPIKLMGRRVIELYDALIGGNDFEISTKLTLKRRAGHTAYVTLNFPAMNLYSWKSNTQGTVPIIDTTQDIEYVNISNTTTQITTKGAGTGQNLQSSILGIGNYLYVGNPQQTFKWDGPSGLQGKTNWGIAVVNSTNSTGPNTAGNGVNLNNGGAAWVNPNNITSAVSYATNTPNPLATNFTYQLQATQFGFTIPAGNQILGVQISFDETVSVTGQNARYIVSLLKNGAQVGNGKTYTPTTTSNTTVTLGGTADLWNTTFTYNDINQTNFGFQIEGIGNNGVSITYQVRHGQITVFGLGGPTVTPTGVGTFSAVNGFTYVIAYGNPQSGEISNASPFSNNTGPFTNKQYVGVPVTASTDPQVTEIRVYRTTDSGGGSIFFELPNSPFANTTATIQDTALDTTLQVTSQAEINLGNTPPPTGLTNLEWFAGRMWGSVNNVLFASTGPETISGKAPNSNWNPTFQYVIPQPIIRNVRGPNGLLVFTVDDCYIVRGTDIVNYTVNEFIKDFGVRTYNAIDTDGTNLFVFTSDRQFIQLTASGANDIGLPIADQLLNVDPTSVYVKVNRYGLDAIVRILDTVNNVVYDYNINQQCWHVPGILKMNACTAAGSIETSPGVWRLLLSTTNSGVSKLAYRDINNFQDLGTSYGPNAVVGSIQLSDPGMLSKFGARGGLLLELENAGTVPVISVLPNDKGVTLTNAVGSQITGNFVTLPFPITNPPTLSTTPVNHRSLQYFWSRGKNLSALLRHFQMQISCATENAATEILGWGTIPDEKSESEGSAALPPIQGR